MSDANKDFYMKVYCDCPPAEEVVRVKDGENTYSPSKLALKVMEQYQQLFGGGRNCKKSNLPRRRHQLPSKKSAGMSAWQRKRAAQREALESLHGDDPQLLVDLEKLDKFAEKAAGDRKSRQQRSLCEDLRILTEERKRDFWTGPCHEIDSKLAEHEKKQLHDLNKIQQMEHRELLTQQCLLPASDNTFVILGNDKREKTRARKGLERLAAGHVFMSSSCHAAVLDGTFQLRSGGIVFVCLGPVLDVMLHPHQHFNNIEKWEKQEKKALNMALMSRLLGASIASRNWLNAVLESNNRHAIPRPILQLCPAHEDAHQVYLSKHLDANIHSFFGALHACIRGSPFSVRTRMLLRDSKKFRLLVCSAEECECACVQKIPHCSKGPQVGNDRCAQSPGPGAETDVSRASCWPRYWHS